MEIPLTECIHTPPPSPGGIAADGPKEGCPEPYSLCFTKANAFKLYMWANAIVDWAQDQMKRCGPLMKGPPKSKSYQPPEAE